MAAAETQEWTLEKGSVVDNYQIGREIGRGGTAIVFEAFDMSLERKVAIKFLNREQATKKEAVIRFQREALAVGKIGHENICDVRDRGITESGILYIVMEHLEGEDLSSLLERQGRIEPEKAVEILLQVLSALDATHQAGIVHRDLKPENIFLAEKLGGEKQVKLLDFGISRFLNRDEEMRLTRTGTVNGTPYYMSHEQAKGWDADHRTDIRSVGVILYEMLTGELPFDGENYNEVLANVLTQDVLNPSTINPEIPRAMTDVILKAMAKDRDERFDNTVEFAEALTKALTDVEIEIPPIAEQPPHQKNRRWFIPVTAAVAALVLVGFIAIYLLAIQARSPTLPEIDTPTQPTPPEKQAVAALPEEIQAEPKKAMPEPRIEVAIEETEETEEDPPPTPPPRPPAVKKQIQPEQPRHRGMKMLPRQLGRESPPPPQPPMVFLERPIKAH